MPKSFVSTIVFGTVPNGLPPKPLSCRCSGVSSAANPLIQERNRECSDRPCEGVNLRRESRNAEMVKS